MDYLKFVALPRSNPPGLGKSSEPFTSAAELGFVFFGFAKNHHAKVRRYSKAP